MKNITKQLKFSVNWHGLISKLPVGRRTLSQLAWGICSCNFLSNSNEQVIRLGFVGLQIWFGRTGVFTSSDVVLSVDRFLLPNKDDSGVDHNRLAEEWTRVWKSRQQIQQEIEQLTRAMEVMKNLSLI